MTEFETLPIYGVGEGRVERHTRIKAGRKGTVVLCDSLNARLVVTFALWNNRIVLSDLHVIA